MKQDMIVIPDLGSSENTKLARDNERWGCTVRFIPTISQPANWKAELPNVKGIIINGGPYHLLWTEPPLMCRPELCGCSELRNGGPGRGGGL